MGDSGEPKDLTPRDVQGLFSDELFRLTVEACPGGMVVSDPAGTILLVNAEAERLFGYSRQELIGQSVDLMVPPRLREDQLQRLAWAVLVPLALAQLALTSAVVVA